MSLPVLSVFGLGKLGSPFAAVMAAKGFKVIGVDINAAYVNAINKGRAPVEEPLLQAFIRKGRKNLRATKNAAEAVQESNISFIIVPTPSGPDGAFSNAFVLDAVKAIARELKTKKRRHTIVVTATVMPGASDGIIRETIEKFSGKKLGRDVGYCYNPEFIALGSVIRDMLNPDFILVGESDACSGASVARLYKRVCGETVPVRRMTPIDAEITKLAINSFVTTKISYANMLADICERLTGADIDTVTSAVGADSRIGKKYLKGAVAYGGPCFPRDNIALSRLAEQLGARVDLAKATNRLNEFQTVRLARRIAAILPKAAHIGIAGMAYKPDTPVVERSAGIALAEELLKKRYKVSITDPLAAGNARKALKGRVLVVADIRDLAKRADALVVMTPDGAFRSLSPNALVSRKRPLVIFDCWRLYADRNFGARAQVVTLGRGKKNSAGQ